MLKPSVNEIGSSGNDIVPIYYAYLIRTCDFEK